VTVIDPFSRRLFVAGVIAALALGCAPKPPARPAAQSAAAVAMPDRYSAEAAAKVLAKGGNAVDAAITAAFALGLTRRARLFLVELPLASPSIVAGVQTSATISVGTATIGALIGAGGFGQSILTGIRLDDTSLILEGALPAAAMAIALQRIPLPT